MYETYHNKTVNNNNNNNNNDNNTIHFNKNSLKMS